LDISKVADIVVLVMNAESDSELGVDDKGENFISLIKAQGLPTILGLLQGLEAMPIKKKGDIKKYHTRYFHTLFPEEPKILPIDTLEEAKAVIRCLSEVNIKKVQWRQKRPYLLADAMSFIVNNTPQNTNMLGTLKLAGFLRGGELSANQLVYIPNFGTFQLEEICSCPDPFTLKQKKKTKIKWIWVLKCNPM